MKHPFLLWVSLLFSLLTATSHATHLKGGSLSWEPVSRTGTTFTVKAKIQLNYDMSDEGIKGATGPVVKGKKTYLRDDIVSVNVGNTVLYWGDGAPGIDFEGLNSRFKVLKVDEAAQILTVEPSPVNPNDLIRSYTGIQGTTYTMNLQANARDNEEVVNRSGTMRLESTVKIDYSSPQPNKPPVFDFKEKVSPGVTIPLPVVVTRSGTATFEVPVAEDPDSTDTVTYRFVNEESEATEGSTEEDPWETRGTIHPSIAYDEVTEKWLISWDTSLIDQTIRTYAFQVVAEDRPTGSPGAAAKSKATIEFQVWVNDPVQDGVPGIELFPDFEVFQATVGAPLEIRIIGTDRNSLGELENSRLKAALGEGEMPASAKFSPEGGFAGDAGGGHHDDHMEAVFFWIPQANQVGSHELNFHVEDEDGHSSPVKTVTVQVGTGPGPQPLLLEVTPGTVDAEDEDRILVVAPPGEPMSFTVTGSCATAGVDIQLYFGEEHHLPGDSVLTPALPVSGTGSVQTVFSWTPQEEDMTSLTEPYKVTFIAGDEHGREVLKTVEIYILPELPTITLAPGEPSTIVASPWETVTFNFNVSGGYGANLGLSINVLDVGAVDEDFVTSPHTSTFTWRVLPGQLPSGVLRLKVTDFKGQSAILSVPVEIGDLAVPAWWDTHGVLTSDAPEEKGVANTGQLKAITKAAYLAIKDEFPNLDTVAPEGVALKNLVDGFSTTNANFTPANQGQVKNVAKIVYQAIGAVTNKDNLGLPWTATTADDQSHALTTVGQIKTIFSFPTPFADAFNDPPVLALTSPALPGDYDTRDIIAITATASDPDGSIANVEFFVNGSSVATDSSPPYTYSWSGMDADDHEIKVIATDNRGKTKELIFPITVEQWVNTNPVVAITSPTSYQTPAANITLTATASDMDGPIKRVSYVYGTTAIGESTTSPYSVPWNTMLVTPGTYQVWAYVEDMDGGYGYASMDLTVTAPTGTSTASITLQQGLKGYTGTMDTYVDGNDPTNPQYNGMTLRMDNGPDMGALLRWDLSLIPTNATVRSATMYLTNAGNTLRDFEVYAMLTDWDTSATWNKATATVNWGSPGGMQAASDRGAQIGFVPGGANITLHTITLNTATVRGWVNNPGTNKGLTIQHYGGVNHTNPLSVIGSFYTFDPSKRPKLVITYDFRAP